MVVVWSKQAQEELKKIFETISLDSLQNAEKVRDTVIDLTIALPLHPEKFPLDKYKTNNDGSWRAFEKYHLRVSYRITPDEIRVVRLRHTKRNPKTY